MTVRFAARGDPCVKCGDVGVVQEVDVGHVTVDWDEAGLVGSPCEEVEILGYGAGKLTGVLGL